MLLPGPEARQLATYLGWRLHGTIGGIVAGAFFVMQAILVLLRIVLVGDVIGMAWVFLTTRRRRRSEVIYP